LQEHRGEISHSAVFGKSVSLFRLAQSFAR